MLAFVLGEVIAYRNIQALLFLTVPIVIFGVCENYSRVINYFKYKDVQRRMSKKKIITVGTICANVMIFLFFVFGIMITKNEIDVKNNIYNINEREGAAVGEVSKILQTDYGWNIVLKNCNIGEIKCGSILVNSKEYPNIKIGNTVKIRGQLEQFQKSRNKGNFDQQKYYRSLGIYIKIVMKDLETTDKNYNVVRETLRRFQICIKGQLHKLCNNNSKGIFSLCDNTNRGIFEAMLLGEKQDLDEEIKEIYQVNGIAHILAISGLHVSFIGMFSYNMFRKKVRFIPAASVSLIVILAFAIITGMGISTVRAVIMFIIRILSDVLGRKFDAITAISTAGVVLLVENPFVLFNSAFQMSFMAIIAVCIVWPIVEKFIIIKNKIFKSLGCSLCVSLIMNPVIAYNYYQLPSYSVILNIIVIPLMSLVIISGISGIIASFISINLGTVIILPGCIVLNLYSVMCRGFGKLPFQNVIIGQPTFIRLILYYGIVSIAICCINIYMKKVRNSTKEEPIPEQGIVIQGEKEQKLECIRNKIKKYIAALIVIIILVPCLYFYKYGEFQISFIDVGQGDGIFMRNEDGKVIFIDGGSSTVKDVGKYRIIPFLKANAVKYIDYAIISHADSDHVSGLEEIIEQSEKGGIIIKKLIIPYTNLIDQAYLNLVNKAKNKGIKVINIYSGHILKFGKLHIRCIHPDKNYIAHDKNNYSTVLDISYNEFKMLLTGDISSETEKEFIDNLNIKYTVLKVPHHGSMYSTTDYLLDKITPRLSIISSGENNSYGHPHEATLNRLRKSSSTILRTDIYGEIDLFINENMRVETYLD